MNSTDINYKHNDIKYKTRCVHLNEDKAFYLDECKIIVDNIPFIKEIVVASKRGNLVEFKILFDEDLTEFKINVNCCFIKYDISKPIDFLYYEIKVIVCELINLKEE